MSYVISGVGQTMADVIRGSTNSSPNVANLDVTAALSRTRPITDAVFGPRDQSAPPTTSVPSGPQTYQANVSSTARYRGFPAVTSGHVSSNPGSNAGSQSVAPAAAAKSWTPWLIGGLLLGGGLYLIFRA